MHEEVGARERGADEAAAARGQAQAVLADAEGEHFEVPGGSLLARQDGARRNDLSLPQYVHARASSGSRGGASSAEKRVADAGTVRRSERWWRYQLTPA